MSKPKMSWVDAEDNAVAPADVVKEVTTQALMADPSASKKSIADGALTSMQAMYGDVVTARSLADQVSKVHADALVASEAGRVNPVAAIADHFGIMPGAANISVVTWKSQGNATSYMGQQVASRMYTRKKAPFEQVSVGDIVIGKSLGYLFGVTRVTDVHYEVVEATNKEDFKKAAKAARTKLAEMAADIADENKTLVDETNRESNQYWNGTAEFAEQSRKGTKDIYRMWVSLFVFEPWTSFSDICPVVAPGKGQVRIKADWGKVYSSWYAGLGPQADVVAGDTCVWNIPQKRGRKPGQKNKPKAQDTPVADVVEDTPVVEETAAE